MNLMRIGVGTLRLAGLPVLAGGLLVGFAPAVGEAAEASVSTAPISAPESPRLITQRFGAWLYRCQEATAEGKPKRSICELAQDVAVEQDGKAKTLMTIVVGPTANGTGHGLTALVPLGVRLKPGLGLAIDDGTAQSIAYDYCGPRGCWVTGAPIDALVPGLKAGKTGRAKLVMLNGREITIEFPLVGFAAGLAALDGDHVPVPDARPGDPKVKPKAK
ncbi:MAG: hypothetical protein JWO51_1133 [Rhodospirillales bacterium]|nr:hypothetical protein [Rhodospirillales bacterium]